MAEQHVLDPRSQGKISDMYAAADKHLVVYTIIVYTVLYPQIVGIYRDPEAQWQQGMLYVTSPSWQAARLWPLHGGRFKVVIQSLSICVPYT